MVSYIHARLMVGWVSLLKLCRHGQDLMKCLEASAGEKPTVMNMGKFSSHEEGYNFIVIRKDRKTLKEDVMLDYEAKSAWKKTIKNIVGFFLVEYFLLYSF